MLNADPKVTRRARFAHWRGERPFWGGAFFILSGAFLLLPPLVTFQVGDLLISVSTVAGVSTVLLGSLMFVCAFTVLTNAAFRVPAGVVAMVLALVALPAANFGGFIVGSLAGIIGAAATLAWRPDPETDSLTAEPRESSA